MKIYVASGLKNKELVSSTIAFLSYFGHKVTCDWTQFDEEKIQSCAEYRQWAIDSELKGIEDCDLFLMILPAGRGSHIELGYATAKQKQIIILGEKIEGVMFYNDNRVTRCYSMKMVLEAINKFES